MFKLIKNHPQEDDNISDNAARYDAIFQLTSSLIGMILAAIDTLISIFKV